MTSLPVVDRELRVAARKRSTFWLRVSAALTGLLIGGATLLLGSFQRISMTEMGTVLFHVISWLCLAAGLCAGLFFTSDCLSEEKREGTLGLLFLTELKGYDVAVGKLLATSLRGAYALLALLPILALTLLMGGVTNEQFWKGSLALGNALFFSLAAGMLVSALSRDSQKALAGTLLILLLCSLGGLAADWSIAWSRKRSAGPFWSLASPGYVLWTASAWGRTAYWAGLAVTQGLGWGMFALACVLVPRTWREGQRTRSSATGKWSRAWRCGGARRRARLRRKLLDRQPVTWLACRERWQSLGVWGLAVVVAGAVAAALSLGMPLEAWVLWNYVGRFFTLLLYLWVASQSCRFFIEARRSGLVELLLATPLTERQIVRGQWRGLLLMFGVPVVLLLSLYVTGATLSQLSYTRIFSQMGSSVSSATTNTSGAVLITNRGFAVTSRVPVSSGNGTNAVAAGNAFQMPGRAMVWAQVAFAAVAAALVIVANLLALCWFGMWMGMTSRTANLATLKTMLFVQVIPWFVTSFGATTLVWMIMAPMLIKRGTSPAASWFAWWPLLTTALNAGLSVGKDVVFILWSRKKLYTSFREQATRIPGMAAVAPVPRVAAPVSAPPVIPVQTS